jgi:hypothetical protein
VDPTGDFVVVWQSFGSSGGDSNSNFSTQGQRYDSAGNAVGSQFQVNTYTTGNQDRPSVTADADGGFVVVWQSVDSPYSDRGIKSRRYDSVGSAVGDEFRVNTYKVGDQTLPSVAAEADGDFVVAWASNGSSGGDTDSLSIQGQRYSPAPAVRVVPSLSLGALGAAALLACLAGGIALRPRI